MWESTNDRELEKRVMAALVWNPRVDQAGIAISALGGVVTLRGNVPSYAMKLAVEHDAELVSGVRSVVQHLEVKVPDPHLRSDGDIAKAAANALDWHVEVPKQGVTISVENGWVTLGGNVQWRYQRDAAEQAIRYLPGVRGVSCYVKIEKLVSPTDVKQRIEAALKRSAEIDARNMSVSASDGAIMLRGKIHSWAERNEALEAAWAAPGVTKVEEEFEFTS